MSRLTALVVDDEAPARSRLQKLLASTVGDRVEVLAEATDGAEALELLSQHNVDILFLDIQMPEFSGFEVLERLAPTSRPIVVFTTAYDTYALRAFEANAVDYLLKPISRERLEDAVVRAERLRRSDPSRTQFDARMTRLLDWLEQDDPQSGPLVPPVPPRSDILRQISVPYRDRILLIPVGDLVTAEIHDGITRLYVLEDEGQAQRVKLRQHVVNYTLDELEAKLDPADFMRVHRSAIVQVNHIHELVPWFSGRFKLVMAAEHEVIASRDRSRLLKDRLML